MRSDSLWSQPVECARRSADNGRLSTLIPNFHRDSIVVLVVCGGSNFSLPPPPRVFCRTTLIDLDSRSLRY